MDLCLFIRNSTPPMLVNSQLVSHPPSFCLIYNYYISLLISVSTISTGVLHTFNYFIYFKLDLTNQMWFGIVCALFLSTKSAGHHSGQNTEDSQGVAE